MSYWKAERTLAEIDAAICADKGNTFKRLQGIVLPHMADAYRQEDDEHRSHLGASVIGAKCSRAIAYGFRWASKIKPRGKKNEPPQHAESRMRRLWNRGHLEEGRFIAMLLMIGVQVYQQDDNGNQFRISAFGGHFSGSGDGILQGVPDLPHGVPCLGEFKTHSEKSFRDLVEFGVKESKPEHYAQMQEYMHHFGLLYALYLAVNKDTEELHGEIVMYDRPTAEHFLQRAQSIIFMTELPSRIRGGNPGFFHCKYMCDHVDVCYSTVKPERNCRTCQHVVFDAGGMVSCGLDARTLDKAEQFAGCRHYELDPMFR